jgi:CHAT domain-containing protein
MAVIMPVLNRPKESTAIFQKIADIQGQLREWAFPALSEAQKVTYARTFDAIQFAFLSHTVTFQKNDPVSLSVCFDAWLANKGSVLQAQGRLQDAILASKDPQVRTLSKTLQETRLQLAHLFQKRPEGLTPENYEQELKELQDRKESLEAGLAKLNQAFAVSRDARRINGAKLATLLPKDSAYLDFARINWYDFEHSHFTEARYLVFVFQPGKAKDLELIDLGTAEPIDKAVQSFQSRVQGGMPLDGNLDPLYQLLIKPLDGFLTERKQLLISPDGPLNLVPFEVLKSQDGTSLMDRFTISYLNSGQDVARFSVPHTASHKVVVLANPDFDLGGEAKSIPGPDMGLYKGKRSIDIGNIHFNPLPGTQKEAKAISSQFQRKDVLSLFGSGALESGLMSVKAPHILHLATHGYFLGHQDTSIEDKLLGSAGRGVKLVGNGGALSAEPRIDSKLENPMLRSGIALARANTSIQKGDDEGLVCAEKILGMDLFGTDLVVLSACNTGVGKVQDGEGVFGLKRAFILAGARTLVVSLWPVPDEETKDLMVQFYKGLVKGKTKAQALAQAKKLIANKKPDPYYWAAFVLVGNPD